MKAVLLIYSSVLIAGLVSAERFFRGQRPRPPSSIEDEQPHRPPMNSGSRRPFLAFRSLPPDDRPIIIRYNINNHQDRGPSRNRGFRSEESHIREPQQNRRPKKFKERDQIQVPVETKLKDTSLKTGRKEEERTLLNEDLSNQDNPEITTTISSTEKSKIKVAPKEANIPTEKSNPDEREKVEEKQETKEENVNTEDATGEDEPVVRVFPYLLIGKTHAGVKFPFLAMMRDKGKSKKGASSDEPFVPAFIAMAPDKTMKPSSNPELNSESGQPELIAAPIFNLPIPHHHDFEDEHVPPPSSNFFRHHEELRDLPPLHPERPEEFPENFQHSSRETFF